MQCTSLNTALQCALPLHCIELIWNELHCKLLVWCVVNAIVTSYPINCGVRQSYLKWHGSTESKLLGTDFWKSVSLVIKPISIKVLDTSLFFLGYFNNFAWIICLLKIGTVSSEILSFENVFMSVLILVESQHKL